MPATKRTGLYIGAAVGIAAVLGLGLYALVDSQRSEQNASGSRDDERLDFCRSVRDAITPGDKLCGKYLAQLKQEAIAEKRAEAAFTPGVEGRALNEVCNSTSQQCQAWTALARKCEDNMRQREQGYMGAQPPFCTQAEQYREAITGIADSSAPGAYSF